MGTEAMTYRERREARAERLREWAGKRESVAGAMYEDARAQTAQIPFGQPILVGHHSERGHRAAIERGWSKMGAAVENSRKAEEMASRADEIERQAAGAIYTDDADAAERLTAKIASMEAERERMKAANAAYRKDHRAALKAMSAYERGQAVPFPSYSITNLGGNISRAKARLAGLDRARARQQTDRVIVARRSGRCADCGAAIEVGDRIRYSRANGARCEQREEA